MSKQVNKKDMKTLPHIIAVDFDGTLVEDAFPEIGAKRFHVWEMVKEAKEKGAKIILWTCRDGENLTKAVDYCKSEGLEFDAVNTNIQETKELFKNDTRKVYANEYWDDKAVRYFSVLEHPMERM